MILDKDNKSLSEILLMTGLTSFLGLLNFLILPAPFIAALLTPLPSIWLVVKYNLKTSLLALLGSVILMVLSGGGLYSVSLILVQYGVLGIVIGLLFKNFVSGRNTIIITMCTAFLIALIVLGATLLTAGGGIWLTERDMQGVLEQIVAFYTEAGIIQDVNGTETIALLEDMVRISVLLFPGSIVLWAMGSAFLTLLIARFILGRFRFEIIPLPSFSEWTLSWVSIWGLILGLALTLLGDEMSWLYLTMVGKNLLFIFGFIYLLLGFAFGAYLFETYNLSKVLKIIIIVLAVLYWPVTLILFFIVGFLDTLLSLRDRIGKKGAEN